MPAKAWSQFRILSESWVLIPIVNLLGSGWVLPINKTGKHSTRLRHTNIFLEQNPGHMQVHFNLAYLLMAENDCKASVEYFKKSPGTKT